MKIPAHLLNKIHLIDVAEGIKNIPDNSIDLTITSPPFYDDDLYILDDGNPEFGWKDYNDYLAHLAKILEELYRITKEGGRLCLILSNSPSDRGGRIKFYYPIIHDVASNAVKNNWYLVDEAIWHKSKPNYGDEIHQNYIPNSQLIQTHDWISVFRKGENDENMETSKRKKLNSVWKLANDGGKKYDGYNQYYSTFPNKLIENCIELWSVENDVIFDPYVGSGQVVRVAINKNRQAIGYEIDPRWIKYWNDINSD